ncbi:hypothetical protein SAMD00023353_11200110 [Rosellinia necatrix]|uniref:Uncharacterized protein n=1 Tax=Rosellinia necatrix TaxID=77044 RepID=A0A1S8AB93_ROSNE|nr:hypothetical protein SAMD00023353_11200110 [Rosellinia necatrix]
MLVREEQSSRQDDDPATGSSRIARRKSPKPRDRGSEMGKMGNCMRDGERLGSLRTSLRLLGRSSAKQRARISGDWQPGDPSYAARAPSPRIPKDESIYVP